MLDLFKTNDRIPISKLHPKFRLLSEMATMDGERKILSEWTEGFVDRDNKIVKQFQTTFHSAFWEFYLFRLFKDLGFGIDFSKNRPDFIITDPLQIFIEGVVSNVKAGGRDESSRNAIDILANLDPPHLQSDFRTNMDEAIVRYANAITEKASKIRNDYTKLQHVNTDAPFIIALSSYSQVNYGREFYHPMVALLYGMYYDPADRSYKITDSITKPGSASQIPLNIFESSDLEQVSAVLFSCTVTVGKLTSLSKSVNNSPLNMNTVLLIREESKAPHYWFQEVSEESPELHSDGLFVFHNPKAKNKLPEDIFSSSCALQVKLTDGGLQFYGNREPIYSRLSLPSLLLPFELKRTLIEEAFARLNS